MSTETVWSKADIDCFLKQADSYQSRLVVKAERLTATKTWLTANGSDLTAQPGDWIVSDGITSWTVAAYVFDATYVAIGDGRFRKAVVVTARQLQHRATVATIEGPARAGVGDWLVCNPGGEVWPVTATEFARRYERLAA